MSSGFTAVNEVNASGRRRAAPAGQIAPRRISIVIPALNEAASLSADFLSSLPDDVCEVILADGGSTDGTRDIAARRGWRVAQAPRGRATQMNAGADMATGEVLLFLHADTALPGDFARHIASVLARPGVVAGAFRLRIDAAGAALRVIEALANFRSLVWGLPFGDQAIFVRAEAFRAVGGYPQQAIMEDVELIRRLRRSGGASGMSRRGRVALAKASVLTSARRWQRLGALRTTVKNLSCQLAYAVGWPPEKIVRWYYGEHT